ncbi:hypothetical protein H8356DRAFT_1430007 [Neocallimastix lanati (nom. inval.)]|jgi:dynein regulatory complex protein 1|uniref:Dynein regulatory complex protein 1/2 N-terminal domain-containing protein n=1 Tax=Neocallimastix californiae TaxID=1754190 RepID=A0A1Y2D7S2_9FUNG|nr:hypothetical protein H8356DRAFT_1430007 [Neocallimastix sp. JGI-2020a]ORY54675.1 hypothetical protein LY90DRAFT_455793 [Neocallimastix californiae]|eukprot:ORY54675.1 hypothetical protein LY90DRAFT_455793 [Neocallimastix californiae]
MNNEDNSNESTTNTSGPENSLKKDDNETNTELNVNESKFASSDEASKSDSKNQDITGLEYDESRNERIMARRMRIENNKKNNNNPKNINGNSTVTKNKNDATEVTGKSIQQTQKSRKYIESTKWKDSEMVTNIRVNILTREAARRAEEFLKSKQWLKKKDEEEKVSNELSDQINQQWNKLFETKGPFKLYNLLQEQHEACQRLTENKDKLINEYMNELKQKEDFYVKELEREAEEIDLLLERMDQQYRTFRDTLQQEIDQIEKAYMTERTELIEKNINEINELYDIRRQKEEQYEKEKSERVDSQMKSLETLRVNDSDEYTSVKIKLEIDIQVLEQQLQQMRATYQLNTEKLEYNYQVLNKREEENIAILTAQKRKITRLSDIINVLHNKINNQDKQFNQENQSLNEDFKRINEQFKGLQKKFRHFQICNKIKFKNVWKMNENETHELMHKLLQADRVITEQQLGLEWKSKNDDLFAVLDPLVFQDEIEEEINPEVKEEHLTKEGSIKEILSRNDSLTLKYKEKKGINGKMRRIFEILCIELEFLVDDKLLKLLEPLDENEQALMKLDSIFKALDVNTIQDIEILGTYFMVNNNNDFNNEKNYSKSHSTENGSSVRLGSSKSRKRSHTVSHSPISPKKPFNIDDSISENKSESDFEGMSLIKNKKYSLEIMGSMSSNPNDDKRSNSSLYDSRTMNRRKNSSNTSMSNQREDDYGLIDPSETMIVIKKFLKDQKRNKLLDQMTTTNNDDQLNDDEFEKKIENLDNNKSKNKSNKLSNKAYEQIQKDYWERMNNIIDEKQYRLWKIVLFSMQKYNKLLTERLALAGDIKSIKEQNDELKALLRQYMNSKINEELEVPPTQIMLAEAGILRSNRKHNKINNNNGNAKEVSASK